MGRRTNFLVGGQNNTGSLFLGGSCIFILFSHACLVLIACGGVGMLIPLCYHFEALTLAIDCHTATIQGYDEIAFVRISLRDPLMSSCSRVKSDTLSVGHSGCRRRAFSPM